MKPFDEKFGENVREAFDNYREPVDEQAWQQMKSRLQAGSKARLFVLTPIFLRAAAAIAFLIVASGSIWLLVLNQGKPDFPSAYEVHDDSVASPAEGFGDTPLPVAGRVASEAEDEIIAQSVTGGDISTGEIAETTDAPALQEAGLAAEAPEIPETTDSRDIAAAMPAPGTLEITATPPDPDIRELPDPEPSGTLPRLIGMSGLLTGEVSSGLVSEQASADADAFIISRNLESMGEAGTGSQRGSVVEVSAGSMKTWSPQEVAGGLGYTAGVGGDWQVGRRVSIHGGGLLVYNQFSLSNTMVPARSFSDTKLDAAPETGLSPGYQVLQYETSDTDVEFTALDIPLNLRFTVREMPGSRIFLSAGFSSFLYLQQRYSSESTVLASFYRMNPQGHYMTETSHANLTSEGEFSAFRRLDLARFLNLSGGYVIRGRNQSIIIEPFLKYPLGDITTLNLNIGMAGLSFKYLPGRR